MVHRALIAVVIFATTARAEPCPPAAALSGDDELVHAVRALLDARGIADERPRCPATRAHIERRGSRIVVAVAARPDRGSSGPAPDRGSSGPAPDRGSSGAAPDRGSSGPAPDRASVGPAPYRGSVAPAPDRASVGAAPNGAGDGAGDGAREVIEREVSEVATAATVIESWTRSDVAAPLLESREVPAAAVERAPAAPPATVSPPAARGIQLFAGGETSFASDRTVWQGMQLEACIMLGPICAAARVHGGKVIASPARWDGFARHGAEIYIGIDIPIALGRAPLTPGFAAGYGAMFTRHIREGEPMGVEISGPRAEVHAAISLPVTAHLAVDVVATGALTQAARMEVHGDPPDPTLIYPAEPRALIRFAVGIRYGAL
ncbi:MAG TPA: hypothetical protein VLM79_07230 [Kofleriaceae bacterium]|nr:hypothetical protein [Kofleriaceae bacterium]